MPHEYEVMLKITSHNLSLPELERRFGPAGPGSHDKSDLHPRGRRWGTSIWRMDSKFDSVDLATQCEEIFDTIDLQSLADVTAVIDIVVHFSSVTVTTSLPARTIRKLAEQGVGIEISCYPVPPEDKMCCNTIDGE